MSLGLYSGSPGLNVGTGLYRTISGLGPTSDAPPSGYFFLLGQITPGNYVTLLGQTSPGAYVKLAGK